MSFFKNLFEEKPKVITINKVEDLIKELSKEESIKFQKYIEALDSGGVPEEAFRYSQGYQDALATILSKLR